MMTDNKVVEWIYMTLLCFDGNRICSSNERFVLEQMMLVLQK